MTRRAKELLQREANPQHAFGWGGGELTECAPLIKKIFRKAYVEIILALPLLTYLNHITAKQGQTSI